MLEFCLFGSGSSGNATLILSENTKILIDSGLSLKQLEQRAAEVGQSLEGLEAVFVTHEHGDHVRGIGVLARRLRVPIYLTRPTYACLPPAVGALPEVAFFESGDTVTVGSLEVSSYSVSHDAADPVSFTVRSNGAKVGFATDLGHASHLVRTRLANSHALVLESNYCPDMLRNGTYPPQIQQRIRGRRGHLSNQDMASLLDDLLHEALRTLILVHISEKNNKPDLAREMAARVLGDHPAKLYLATQDAPTRLFEVAGS